MESDANRPTNGPISDRDFNFTVDTGNTDLKVALFSGMIFLCLTC